jgi:uronate dehydrogenase
MAKARVQSNGHRGTSLPFQRRNNVTKVALSGASGNIGRLLRVELPKRGIALRSAGGRRPVEPLHPGEDVMHGDLRDPAVVDRLLESAEVLIHMAGTSVERPLPEIIDNNLVALREVYEGARRNKVRLVVTASSNHAFGMYASDAQIDISAPFRPDSFYGVSKVWGEAIARMYWEKHGIEGVALRIWSCEPRPLQFRHLSTWLGHDDTVQLIMCCINAQNVGFIPVWGISNNTRSYVRDVACERIGYQPRQNAEHYAEEILKQKNPLDAIGQKHMGGAFASADYTPPEVRPSRH